MIQYNHHKEHYLQCRSPPSPSFPFQLIVANYLSLQGMIYLGNGDRFSGWVSVYSCADGKFDGSSLSEQLRHFFTTFNIPEEISTDGGPQMMSQEVQDCFKKWGIRHRLSSAYFPLSNSRAELSINGAKLLLIENVKSNGSLNNDKFMSKRPKRKA